MPIRAALLAGMFLLGSAAVADEPPGEQLPQPQEVAPRDVLPPPRALPQLLLLPLPPRDPPPQMGRRDVWQYFAPGWSGRFVPRVIYSPSGSYYLYNGAPYHWTTTQPQLYMRYLVD